MINQNSAPKPKFQAPALPTNGYSLQAKLKQQQKQKETLEQIETEKQKEKKKLKLDQEDREHKMAEARLRQIDLDNQRAHEQRLQQREQQDHVRNKVSGIGRGLQTQVSNAVGTLQFLDRQDFPFQQHRQNSKLRLPQQFVETDQMSQNIDGLDLGTSIKPVIQGQSRVARVGQMLESLNLHTGMQGLRDRKGSQESESDEEMQNYRRELASPTVMEQSIRESVQNWKQLIAGQKPQVKRHSDYQQLVQQQDEEFEVIKPQFEIRDNTGYAKIHKGQYIAAVKKPPVQTKPPAKPQSIISETSTHVSQKRVDSAQRALLLKSDILSKEDEARIAREKKIKLDEIKKKYSGRGKKASSQVGSRANSQASRGSGQHSRDRSQNSNPRDATKCTRDEDLNIEEFMREDMRQINKDEDRLQRELMSMHQRNLGKHAKVLQKYRIDVSHKTTEDLLRRFMCLPKSLQEVQQRKLYQGKSAVNKRPDEFKQRPDAGEDGQADQLLQSIENLDKLLASMQNGKKETVLEQLATKIGLISEVENESNYAGRPPTAKASQNQPTLGQIPLPAQEFVVLKPEKLVTKPQVIPKSKPVVETVQIEEQKVIFELKEANLMKLEQKYQQPFSVKSNTNDDDQFSQAPTAKPMSKISQQPSSTSTRAPLHKDPSPHRSMLKQPSPHRSMIKEPSPQRSMMQQPSPQRMMVREPSPVQKRSQQSSMFPPIPGQQIASTPTRETLSRMDDLMEQQRILQQNIDNLQQMQRDQSTKQLQHQQVEVEPMPTQVQKPLRAAWGNEQVKVNPNFNPKLLFDSD